MIHTKFDIEVTARTVIGEARGEPIEGQEAVAWVIRHRAIAGRFGGPTLAHVCLRKAQFSSWNDGDPNREVIGDMGSHHVALMQAIALVERVMYSHMSFDLVGGSCHYHHKDMDPKPGWAIGKPQVTTIGNHAFYVNIS